MLLSLLNYIHEYCDAPRPWGLYFQDSAAPQMEALVELHDNIMYYLITILFGVSWILASIIKNYASNRSPIVKWLGKSLLWENTLSNFGDLLKLLIPNSIWKYICGWTNYSGMVTSQMICENKMDNRESKSDFITKSVKEQRVDGNEQVYPMTCLRGILTGFERNCQLNNQSKLINKRFFSSTSIIAEYSAK